MFKKAYLVVYHDHNNNLHRVKGIYESKEDAEKEFTKLNVMSAFNTAPTSTSNYTLEKVDVSKKLFNFKPLDKVYVVVWHDTKGGDKVFQICDSEKTAQKYIKFQQDMFWSFNVKNGAPIYYTMHEAKFIHKHKNKEEPKVR